MLPLLLSTACFPPARYVSACLKAERIVIEQHETYPKQTIRNHYEIAGPNGRQKLTVPVVKPSGSHTKTRDVRIAYDQPWQAIHRRSIETAYNKAPFSLYYAERFQRFFERRYDFLLDLNLEILSEVLKALEAGPEISLTTEFVKEPEVIHDLRNIAGSKKSDPPAPLAPYTQPFTERYGFLENLSVLDVIYCLGPGAREYLEEVGKS